MLSKKGRIIKICSAESLCEFISANEYLLPDPFSRHVNLNTYSEKLTNFGETFAFIEETKNIAGIASGYINDYENKEAHLQLLLVQEKAQGRGIASALINEFITLAISRFQHGKVFLTVDSSNLKAQAIYRHKGFVSSQRLPAKINKQIMEYDF